MATKYYSLNYFRLYDPSGEGGAAEPGGNEVSVFPLTFTFDTSRSKLEVRLDEVVLAEGYTYDPETKTVIFDEPPQGNYLLIRRGHPWDALFDIGFWYMVLVGLPMLVLPGKDFTTSKAIEPPPLCEVSIAKRGRGYQGLYPPD